jgi:hypothetical protein
MIVRCERDSSHKERKMALAVTIEMSFGGNEMQLARLADYLTAISPCVEKHPESLPVFVESLTIAVVALHELPGISSVRRGSSTSAGDAEVPCRKWH